MALLFRIRFCLNKITCLIHNLQRMRECVCGSTYVLSMLIPSLTYEPTYKVRVGKLPAVRKPLTPRKFMACICVVLRSPLVMSCRAVEKDGAKGFSLLRCSVVVLPSDKDLVFASGIETPAPPPFLPDLFFRSATLRC